MAEQLKFWINSNLQEYLLLKFMQFSGSAFKGVLQHQYQTNDWNLDPWELKHSVVSNSSW